MRGLLQAVLSEPCGGFYKVTGLGRMLSSGSGDTEDLHPSINLDFGDQTRADFSIVLLKKIYYTLFIVCACTHVNATRDMGRPEESNLSIHTESLVSRLGFINITGDARGVSGPCRPICPRTEPALRGCL